MRLVLVPRWGGDATCDWIPWLRRELRDVRVDVARLRPSPGAPAIAPTVEAVRRLCEGEPPLLVGHSVGAQAAMRAAEAVPVAGLLLVAGWWTVDDPWDSIRPWIATPVDGAAVRRNAPAIRVLLGDDDPFTSDHAATAARFESTLGATVTVLAGARHLNRPEEPAVLEGVRALLKGAAG